MKTEKSCGAVVFTKEYDDFKYVIIRSKGGTYGFPKGHVEKDETEKETALREIMEETGLKVEFLDKFKAEDSYKFTRNGVLIEKTVVYFLAECNSLTFKTNEEEIESIILDKTQIPPVKVGGEVGRITRSRTSIIDYVSYLTGVAEDDLNEYGLQNFNGLKIAVDCSNGAASITAPRIFMNLCDDCFFMACHPNGTNINEKCGSTHLEVLQDFVVRNKCDAGLAFDGDADRFLAVDENGNVVDGDKLIAIFAKHMKSKGKLKNNAAVVTVMSNMGFFKFCEENDIHCEKTKVGDRYVLENMLENDYIIGGEQSGHIIFREFATTGDGELSALKLLCVMKETGKKLSELASEMEVFPQVLVNVRVSDFGKARFPRDKEIKNAIEAAEKELGNEGRVLVRVSGTEPLVRVMLEGKDEEKINVLAQEIAQVVRERLL